MSYEGLPRHHRLLFLQLALLALIRARRQSRTRKDHLRMPHATGGLRQKQGRETGARGKHRDSNGSRAEQGRFIASDKSSKAPRVW